MQNVKEITVENVRPVLRQENLDNIVQNIKRFAQLHNKHELPYAPGYDAQSWMMCLATILNCDLTFFGVEKEGYINDILFESKEDKSESFLIRVEEKNNGKN